MLQGRFVNVQLIDLMLGKIADAQLGGPCDLAVLRHQFARQELGQGRFALTIAAQQRNAVVLIDPQVQLFQNGRPAIAHSAAVHVDDGWGQFFRLWEGKDHGLRLFGRGDQRHLFQHLDARLGLHGFRCLGFETIDKALQMRAAGVLLFRLGRLVGAAFSQLARKLVVRAVPQRQLLLIKVQNGPHGAVQQATVVADDDHGVGVFLQVAFQPQRAFQIKIVGRFVQEQIIGLGEQNARQSHAHPPAA